MNGTWLYVQPVLLASPAHHLRRLSTYLAGIARPPGPMFPYTSFQVAGHACAERSLRFAGQYIDGKLFHDRCTVMDFFLRGNDAVEIWLCTGMMCFWTDISSIVAGWMPVCAGIQTRQAGRDIFSSRHSRAGGNPLGVTVIHTDHST